jgi:NADPH:quinone reductase-like Zn-dependent oxidoreductase
MRIAIVAVLPLLLASLTAHASGADARGVCSDDVPARMRAVLIDGYGGPERLRLDTIPVPDLRAGEVLVRVSAASVNSIDWLVRDGEFRPESDAFPMILGRDISGVVVGLGPDSGGWKCGDRVVAFLDDSRQGGYAEYVPASSGDLAHAPRGLGALEAAAFPLVATTAWQALVDHGELVAGERVLIHGGAGGVGSIAVQIAKRRGAIVVATASARNHDYLRSLGADEVIDYTTQRFEEVAGKVDLVFDTVGGDTLTRSFDVLGAGGRLVSITERPPQERCRTERIACSAFNAESDPATLQRLATWFGDGTLRINVEASYPLARAAEAQERNRARRTRGKIVLEVGDDAGFEPRSR